VGTAQVHCYRADGTSGWLSVDTISVDGRRTALLKLLPEDFRRHEVREQLSLRKHEVRAEKKRSLLPEPWVQMA